MATKRVMKVWEVYWSPTGQKIATVKASTARAARRKAPSPYRKYLGEIYVKEIGAANPRRANPSHAHLIPAKVIVGKNGKMRVFVSGKAARELAGHRAVNPLVRKKRELSVPEKHQLRIAEDTLRMPDAMAEVMGGPTKAEAREIIYRLTGKKAVENRRRRRR